MLSLYLYIMLHTSAHLQGISSPESFNYYSYMWNFMKRALLVFVFLFHMNPYSMRVESYIQICTLGRGRGEGVHIEIYPPDLLISSFISNITL